MPAGDDSAMWSVLLVRTVQFVYLCHLPWQGDAFAPTARCVVEWPQNVLYSESTAVCVCGGVLFTGWVDLESRRRCLNSGYGLVWLQKNFSYSESIFLCAVVFILGVHRLNWTRILRPSRRQWIVILRFFLNKLLFHLGWYTGTCRYSLLFREATSAKCFCVGAGWTIQSWQYLC